MNKPQILKKLKPLWKKNKNFKSWRQLAVVCGLGAILIAAGLIFYLSMQSDRKSHWQEVTDEYYDPIDLVLYDTDIQLVDIRRAEQYKEGYIKGAMNIPASFKNGEIENGEEIIERFSKLSNKSQIVLYGENNYTLRTIKVARLLEDEGIKVKVLRVGWTEFFHFQTFWLPEELSSKVNILHYIELPE